MNDDGRVSPVDALAILVDMQNQNAIGENASARDRMYVDVDGNGQVTAIDALRVLNEIERNRNSGEPEQWIDLQSLDEDDDDLIDAIVEDVAESIYG